MMRYAFALRRAIRYAMIAATYAMLLRAPHGAHVMLVDCLRELLPQSPCATMLLLMMR